MQFYLKRNKWKYTQFNYHPLQFKIQWNGCEGEYYKQTFITERNRSNRLIASEKVSDEKPKNLVRDSRSFTSSSLSLVVILRPLSWEVSISLKPLSFGWYLASKSIRVFTWTAKGCALGSVTVSIICVDVERGKSHIYTTFACCNARGVKLNQHSSHLLNPTPRWGRRSNKHQLTCHHCKSKKIVELCGDFTIILHKHHNLNWYTKHQHWNR